MTCHSAQAKPLTDIEQFCLPNFTHKALVNTSSDFQIHHNGAGCHALLPSLIDSRSHYFGKSTMVWIELGSHDRNANNSFAYKYIIYMQHYFTKNDCKLWCMLSSFIRKNISDEDIGGAKMMMMMIGIMKVIMSDAIGMMMNMPEATVMMMMVILTQIISKAWGNSIVKFLCKSYYLF